MEMFCNFLTVISIIIILAIAVFNRPINAQAENIIIDYEMAEKAIDWLEYINSGADDNEIKNYFMDNVAPTRGCQAIIYHWARFKKWDNEEFYKFIMEALGRLETDKPLISADGAKTRLGIARPLWLKALKNPNALRKDIEVMKRNDLQKTSVEISRKYLPDETDLTNNFYIILFGASTAFSVGDENGYDLLQLPRKDNGELEIDEVVNTFAHEIHHTGFSNCTKKYMSDVKNDDRILIIGIMAAEGMPTFYINKPFDKLKKYAESNSDVMKGVAADWVKYNDGIYKLFEEVESDIQLNLNGNFDVNEIYKKYLSGMMGKAYVLGVNMYKVIDKYLGREAAIEIVKDYRKFLTIYNKAANIGKAAGENLFLFDDELAKVILNHK